MSLIQLVASDIQQAIKRFELFHQRFTPYFCRSDDQRKNREPILDNVSQTVSGHIGDKQHSCIHMDESGFPKQGNDSVDVRRQYCGCLGKVDNCQVGVFIGYTI